MAHFWAAMLGTSVRGRWEHYDNLHPVAGGPVLAFQRVETKSPGKNALHLDLHVTDERERDEVARRVEDLGGRVVDLVSQDDTELSMGVMRAWRGRGIGSRLLGELIAAACEHGLASLSLSVEPDNYARRLYERVGFRRADETNGSLTMLLPLRRPS